MIRTVCAFNKVVAHGVRISTTSLVDPVTAVAASQSARLVSSSVIVMAEEPATPETAKVSPAEIITLDTEDNTSADRAEKKRRMRVPPISVQDYMESKRYLYVTDLVGPTWCEYSYQYNIMGMSHLPISERPETITLPSGKELRPSAELVQKRETIKKTGNQIHAKLEREVHPEKITVQTQSDEDRWALRLLKLIVGLRSLIDRGCVRELPVFGWAEQYLVTGIIDEIEKRPLSKRRQAQATEIYNAANGSGLKDDQTKLPFAEATSTSSNVESPSPKKTWSSQEEWKAHQRKADNAKKAAAKSRAKTKSPRKSKAGEGDVAADPKQKGLQSFYGSSSPKAKKWQDDEVPEHGMQGEHPAETATAVAALRGFFLSDTKTRTFDSLPQVPEQRGARLQTMMYKRMLDGLCQGAVERSIAAQGRENGQESSPSAVTSDGEQKPTTLINHTAIGIRGDPDATPLDFSAVFASQGLSPDQSLSQAFRDDAQELLDELDVSQLPIQVAQTVAAATADADTDGRKLCLSDLVHVVDEHLIELLVKAQRDCSVPETKATDKELKQHIFRHHRHDASAIQTDLGLIYRLQQRKKKSKARTKTKSSTLDIETLPEIQAMIQKSLEGQAELALSTQEEDGKGFEVISLSSSPPLRRSRRLAGASTSNTETPLPNIDARTPSLSQTLSQSPPPPKIIGQVTFPSLSFHLTAHLKSILEFWHGKREPVGVGENETWKCRGCEWFEGCEWRHGKGEEKRLWAAQRRKERLTRESQGEGPNWMPIEYSSEMDQIPKNVEDEDSPQPTHTQDDYEESLWAHFDPDDQIDLPSSQIHQHTVSSHSLNAQEQDWIELQADRAASR